jgi:hypothetical protein
MSGRSPARRRAPFLFRALKAAPLMLAAALPAGCGPQTGEFAPACPHAALAPGAADLTRYRPGSTGRGIIDTVLQARIVSVDGVCKDGGPGKLDVSVRMGVELTKGPAMQGREADVPVFLAAVEGVDQKILDEETYLVHATFPSNVDKITLVTSDVPMVFPVNAQKTGAAYTIYAGFRVTREQLQENQQRTGR